MKNFFKKIFQPIDLTSGKPWKVIVLFAIPILLSQLFQQLYTTIDAIIIGQTIHEQFAGISATNPINFLILQLAFGCASGFSISISNKFGDKDMEGTKKAFIHTTLLSIIIALILTVISCSTTDYLLQLVGITNSKDPISFRAAHIYLLTICAGIIAQVLYNVIVSVNRAIGDSVTPLIFLVISSVFNICLDLLMVYAMPSTDLKVFGVAFATIISQFLSAILCFAYTLKKYKFLRFKFKDLKLEGHETLTQLKSGLPLGFQFSVLAIGFIVLQNAIVSFDTAKHLVNGVEETVRYAQNGYGVSNRLSNLLMAPYIALGTSMLSYSAMNYGLKNYKRLRQGYKSCSIIAVIITVICTSLGLLLTINHAFVYIFLDPNEITPETIRYAETYLYCVLPFSIFLTFLMSSRSMIQGMQKPIWPLVAGVLELTARIIACVYLPQLVSSDPHSMEAFIAVCFADSLAWVIGALSLIAPLIYNLIKLKKLENNPKSNELDTLSE